MRLASRLWELRAAQLSFTPQQAVLLKNSGLRLSPQQVEVLHRRTGGWAAGLHAVRRYLKPAGEAEVPQADALSELTVARRSLPRLFAERMVKLASVVLIISARLQSGRFRVRRSSPW